jgi:hypothetical protein
VQTDALVGSNTQQPVAAASASQAARSQPIKNPHPPSASLLYAVVNREGHDIVTKENCSLLLCAAFFLLLSSMAWDCAKLSLYVIEHNCAYVKLS